MTGGRVPIAGFLHAGGVLRDGALPNQTSGMARAVFTPKASAFARVTSATFASPKRYDSALERAVRIGSSCLGQNKYLSDDVFLPSPHA